MESKFGFANDNPHFTVVADVGDRARWLAARSQYIGSSDASAILGENPWASVMDVYANKLAIEEPEHDPSEPSYWGLQLEPVLLKEFTRRTSRPAESWGELLVSKERPWQACTMDGVQFIEGVNGGIEAKCTRLAWRWEDGVPPYVYAQVQHQYAVTGLALISICVLFNGNEYYWKDIPRDEEYIAFLNEKELEFYDRLKAFEPPDPDSSESCRKALSRLYPRDSGERVVLGPEFNSIDTRLIGLKQELKDIQGDIRECENQIKAAMKDATSAILADGTIYTFKTQQRRETVVPASEFRVLRRKGAPDGG